LHRATLPRSIALRSPRTHGLGTFGAAIEPTILFDQTYTFTLGGVRFELQSTPGETPDHLTVWIPAYKIAFIGDNYNGFGEPEPMSFPNLYALRGTKPRWALDWIASIDKVLALKPDVVLSGHGAPDFRKRGNYPSAHSIS
jgi:glyoxylase-like metal-dependent hydrolase (beta-lactamase superfamily II)